MKTRGLFSKCMLGLGFAFLYVPIIALVVFSFNDSRSVTVWNSVTSPSLRWYRQLLKDDQVLSAAWLSIQVAAMSATGISHDNGRRPIARRGYALGAGCTRIPWSPRTSA